MRLKIVAGNLAVVVLLGLAAYVIVSQQLKDSIVSELNTRVGNDRAVFERSYRLSAYEFLDLVSKRAADPQLSGVFSGLDVSSRRTRAYEAAEATQAWLADPARWSAGAPDLVVVTDETGAALARNGARNVMFGKKLAQDMPALKTALETGGAAHDSWLESQENKVLQIAVAAIRGGQGAVLGALVVGYDLSNGMATREAKLIGGDVAIVVEGNVYSSSLGGTKAKLLKDVLFGQQGQATSAVLSGAAAVSPVFTAQVGSTEYAALTAALPMSASHPVAFTVLGNRTEALAMVSSTNVIIIMTVLGALLVIAYGFFLGGSVMRQIERIEEDVLAVINGRTDLRLDTDSEDLGGLAYRINQLLNVFTGTEETGSEDSEGVSMPPSSAHWQGAAFAEGGGGGAGSAAGGGGAPQDEVIDDPALAQQLAAEDEAAYGARIYGEYMAAKQALGENVSNIPQDRFLQRINARGAALAKKHGCRAVRFRVETFDNQVLLRPVLIR